MIDGLTGLNNFRQFDEIFNNLVNDLSTRIQNLSLLYIDIDYFKKINDTYGHYEGDFVLKELGIILKNYTRSYDTVSRNGGEEFTVLLPDCNLNRAIEIAERIRKSVEENEFTLTSGEVTKLTISIGVSSYRDTTNDPFLLIEDADKALYRAKKSGRNKVCYAIREIKD
jgi:diguanylate cyclase